MATTNDTQSSGKGVDDGPGKNAEPKIDPNKVGPDGTVYDEEATEEAHERMTGGRKKNEHD